MRKKLLLYILTILIFPCQSGQESKEFDENTVSVQKQVIENQLIKKVAEFNFNGC